MTEIIMWHSDADICVSSVHSNKPPKTVHNQVAVPLTTYGHSKQRNLNGNTHPALQCVCQQHSLQFLSPYCITECVPATLSAVPVTILHYSVCASKAVYSSCHHGALQCVCQQHSLQFLSPWCITVCVPATLSAVPVTILHYSVCASKDLCSSCHHTALQCVCQQHSLQFLSPYCIIVCVPARLSTVAVTILPD